MQSYMISYVFIGRKTIGEPEQDVLLRGELVRQGSNKQDVLGASRHSDQNNPLDTIDEVQVNFLGSSLSCLKNYFYFFNNTLAFFLNDDSMILGNRNS